MQPKKSVSTIHVSIEKNHEKATLGAMTSIEKTKIITRSHSGFCPSRGTLDFNEVTGMIEGGGKNQNPKKFPSTSNKTNRKNPMPNFRPIKIFRKN